MYEMNKKIIMLGIQLLETIFVCLYLGSYFLLVKNPKSASI